MRLVIQLALLICLNNEFIQAQKQFPILSLDDSNWLSNQSIQDGFDTMFHQKRIIGLGEATHGTSEFTTVRHKLFQYLVEKKGFNTFVLEADYSGCQRINRYINGQTDDPKAALSEVQYWVWHTEEMLNLIEWMRLYNQSHV